LKRNLLFFLYYLKENLKRPVMIIRIKQLKTSSLIGIRPEEYIHRQPLIIDLEVHYDYQYNVDVNTNENYVDYVSLEQFAKTYVESKHHGLLEDLAHLLLDAIMETYPSINFGKISFSKPEALMFSDTVELEYAIRRK
jgi:7,8-dihydroneopterin aldolase/epimerase/oxygenase